MWEHIKNTLLPIFNSKCCFHYVIPQYGNIYMATIITRRLYVQHIDTNIHVNVNSLNVRFEYEVLLLSL